MLEVPKVGPRLEAASRVRISLCLLTWNEIDGCRHDVPKLPINAFDQVYAVDGGSTDGTVEYLQSMGIAVHRQPVRGYNQAYRHAFSQCTSDFLVLFHPKGTIDPQHTLKFREPFENGCDLVIGSRNIAGARNEEDDLWLRPRKWFVIGLSLLAALIWKRKGLIAWDVLHGFRGMRKDKFEAIEPLQAGLSVDLEMVVRSYRKGFKLIEFPTQERERLAGETHFKAFRTGKQLLAYLVAEIQRKA